VNVCKQAESLNLRRAYSADTENKTVNVFLLYIRRFIAAVKKVIKYRSVCVFCVRVAPYIRGLCGPDNVLTVNASESFQLRCDVIGSPVPVVHWKFNVHTDFTRPPVTVVREDL